MTTTLRDFGGGLDTAPYEELVADESLTGYLIDCGGDDCERLKLVRCPVEGCPESFDRYWRSARNDPLAEHLAEAHDPEDVGLAKRGERR